MLVLIVCFPLTDSFAQRGQFDRRNGRSEAAWPPERAYSRISLGYALQRVFRKHYEFCGFPIADGRRDYTPPTLERFLGKRNLRTKVEQADISGTKMLAYIFNADELEVPLDELSFQSSRLLELAGAEKDLFDPKPREGFDAFIMSRNCSGYLKASLDAGFEPPYAAFSAALNTDDQRQSSVITVAGNFSSPLADLLVENTDRTTELMSRLWRFYEDNPSFNGQAYYLREFEGVMVRHLSNATAIFNTERQLGVNVSLPFSARLKSEIQQGRGGSLSFGGTDWETIVFADFDREYERRKLFTPLPSVEDIAAYFQNLDPAFVNTGNYPVLTENSPHEHQLRLSGVTAEVARAPWELISLSPGVYRETPSIIHDYYQEADGRFGLVFTVRGIPHPDLFSGRKGDRRGAVELEYTLALAGRHRVALQVGTRQEIATSLHPVLDLVSADFDLTKRDNQRYAFEWEIELQVEDRENPVDMTKKALLELQQAGNELGKLEVLPVSAYFNAARHTLVLTVATVESWPLSRIDDRQMIEYNLTGEVELPTQRGKSAPKRPLRATIAMPSILPEFPPEEEVDENKEK